MTPPASDTVRCALVTGAGRGIGRGIALELARGGFGIVLNYAQNRGAALRTLDEVREAGVSVVLRQADVARRPDRQRLVDCALRHFGRIDVLVNNAGIAPSRRDDILEAREEEFDRVLSVNLRGPYFLTQRVAREMVASRRASAAEDGYRPVIVTVSSVSAVIPSTNRGEYCVSKAGLSMLTRLFAARLAPEGIGVFEIQPGLILTDMTAGVRRRYDAMIREGRVPLGRWGEPGDVARVVRALAEGTLAYSTGEVIRVDGGLHLPTL